jgi:arsenite-transporting ATPase
MRCYTPPFLDNTLRLILFGGKGGVGKTTCATAAALLLARSAPAKTFRLISADPAHSLLDSLAGCSIPQNLTVLELDANERTSEFRAATRGRLHEIVAAGTFLDGADIDQLLDLSLPGLDELAVFLEISESLERNADDCMVMDTAPSGHTLRLLTITASIRLWVEALDALLAKRRYMRQVFGQAKAEDPLEDLVAGWNGAIDQVETLLRDATRCRFIPVTTAESLGVRETARLWKELQHLRVPVSDLIVNQVHLASDCPTCAWDHKCETAQVEQLAAISRPAHLWAMELLADEVRGERILAEFWDHARLMEAVEDSVTTPATSPKSGPKQKADLLLNREPRVGMPPYRPSPEMQFLLFSGKGGVGKTTLACATALRMAYDYPSKQVLLLSTDPAHSLSRCLETAVGSFPTQIFRNLAAMEIDAEAEFGRLRPQYERDVEELLSADSRAFELAFDRAAIGKILEMAPPGLDEVMALTGIIDLLTRDRYDLVVLDSASTGHFIRLLELPRLVEQWLATLFGLLLKYKRVLRLPRFTDQLIQLSKNLKTFRKILSDSARAALYAVGIPTEMALAETKDLLAACARIGVSAPIIFLNRLTPAGNCRLCTSLERRESRVLGRYEQAFPDHQMVLVYRQGELTGVDRLLRFGESLYRAVDWEACHAR